MDGTMEIYDEYKKLGIKTRKITQGAEFELVRAFIDYRKETFKASIQNNLAIFIEPKINNSYPDIVFVNYNPENYSDWNESRTNLTITDYKILYHIFIRKGVNAREINEQLGISWKDITLALERLYDAKVIDRRSNRWCIRNNKIFGVKNIEAVEAKINNVGKVFQQALINKNFASESYVLLSEEGKINSENQGRFNRFGIGIYAANSTGFNRLNLPSRVAIPVSFTSIYFNEWIGKILLRSEGVN